MPNWFHRKNKSRSNAPPAPPEIPSPTAVNPDELAQRLESLDVQSTGSKRPSTSKAVLHDSRPFVGGFAPSSSKHNASPPKSTTPPVFPSPSLATAGVGGFHVPDSIPNHRTPFPMLVSVPQNPQRPTSMTMQHALAGLYTPPPAQPSSDLRPLPGHPKPQSDPGAQHPPALSSPPHLRSGAPSPPKTPARPTLSPPALHARPHSDSKVKPPYASAGPSTTQPPLATPLPKRRRNSTPSSPATSIAGSASGNTVQCSGQTKAGRRCTRQVKIPMSVARLDEDEDEAVEIFCFQHSKELMGQSGFYARQNGEWVEYKDWIPNYLSQDTQVALRIEMEKARSLSDQAGYIYTFEIRDKKTPSHIHLKVGRAVNLTKRIDEWGKQCKSKEPILRGWWPGSVEEDNSSLLKGRVKAGDKGPCCHRLERLVHLELTDLTLNKPYLHPNFPNQAPTPGNGRTNSNSTASGKKADARCEDCGQRHKEIFTFERPQIGPYVGKEWEKLVLPVIEKWGGFVRAYV